MSARIQHAVWFDLGSLTGQDPPGRSADGRGYFCRTTLADVSLGANGHVVRSAWGRGKAVGAWLGHAGRAERLDRGQRLDQEPPAGHLTDADRTSRARSRVAPDREACGRCQAQTGGPGPSPGMRFPRRRRSARSGKVAHSSWRSSWRSSNTTWPGRFRLLSYITCWHRQP